MKTMKFEEMRLADFAEYSKHFKIWDISKFGYPKFIVKNNITGKRFFFKDFEAAEEFYFWLSGMESKHSTILKIDWYN